MRQFFLLLLFPFLLLGCAAAAPAAAPIETVPLSAQAAAVPEVSAPPAMPSDPLQSLLSVMTVEEKVGQLFLARCPQEQPMEDLTRFHLGGYLLFAQDFEGETPDSIGSTIAAWQNAAPIPLLIAADEEGGAVCRISRYPAFRASRFPSPRQAFASGGMEAVLTTETEKAVLLKELGLNVNLGPVCDITTDTGAFLYQRSLGQSPRVTEQFVTSTVQIMKNHGIGSVLKHFPGYGNNADTHTGMVRDTRTLEALEETDLRPFSAGIQAGCDAILVSHNIVEALDPGTPASLSPAIHDYLRKDMGFKGVILTDDLVMEAITEQYSPEEAAVLAILAGNDLLCSSEYQVQYPAVLEAVGSGRISMEQLDASVLRILQWKKDLGLIF